MLRKIIIIVASIVLIIVVAASYFYTTSQSTKKSIAQKKQEIAKQPTKVESKQPSANVAKKKTSYSSDIEAKILENTDGLKKDVLDHALTAYHWAVSKGDVKNPNVLTIVDFSKPSYEKRMWVVDMNTGKELMSMYTTHGSNSGMTYATSFSNRPGSDQSSVGVFVTLNPYQGKHGLSERLKGLEPGINDNAYRRDIVIHPAWYATPSYISSAHRAGRSWGCFALDPAKSSKYVNLTKNGTVLYAYGKPEENDPVAA